MKIPTPFQSILLLCVCVLFAILPIPIDAAPSPFIALPVKTRVVILSGEDRALEERSWEEGALEERDGEEGALPERNSEDGALEEVPDCGVCSCSHIETGMMVRRESTLVQSIKVREREILYRKLE